MKQMTGQECCDIISVSREIDICCDGVKAEKVGAVSRDEQVSWRRRCKSQLSRLKHCNKAEDVAQRGDGRLFNNIEERSARLLRAELQR